MGLAIAVSVLFSLLAFNSGYEKEPGHMRIGQVLPFGPMKENFTITGNLDSVTSERIYGLFERAERELTLVVVTHNPELAGQADRIFSLLDGRIAGCMDRVVEPEHIDSQADTSPG